MENAQRLLEAHKRKLREIELENPYIRFAWKERQPGVYVKISGVFGNTDEFTGGEYIAEITIGENYPMSSPHLKFLTPNGVTRVNESITLSHFGQYCPVAYSPALNVSGIACLLPVVLLQWQEINAGIGFIMSKNKADIARLARESADYNATKLSEINALFTAGAGK